MPDDKRARLKEWLQSGEATLHPLSLTQRELWEASAVPAADPANHIGCFISVQGAISPPDCVKAVERVVERQEVLRLSILPGKERMLQLVRKSAPPSIEFGQLKGSDPEEVEEAAAGIFAQPFDLLQGPLYRIHVLSRSPESHVMVLGIHHAIADGWSLGIFVRDLCGAYLQGRLGLKEPLPEPAMSYTAWGAAERAFWQPAELQPRAKFWSRTLAGAPRIWKTPETFARLERWRTAIPGPVGNAARELAKRNGATLFNLLLATFQIAVSRYTGQQDIVVGSPVANRGKQAARETMGSFAGVVPLRGQVDHQRPFLEGLREVHQSSVDCFANAMPFVELAHALGDKPAPGHHPVFQVRFALQNHPVPDVAVPGLSAQLRMRSTGTQRFDLGCEITEQGDSMEVVWLYHPNLFSAGDIHEMDRIFQGVLEHACRLPDTRIANLSN